MKKEKLSPKETKKLNWEYFIFFIAIFLSGYLFLAPGHPTTGDVWPHLVRQKIIYQSIKEKFSPFFTFYFYSGYPHLQFYSPLFFFITGIFTLLTSGNLIFSLKIVIFILHILSALAIFYYLKKESENSFLALLGSIGYIAVPWRILYIAAFGNYPLSLIYLLLPLIFLYLDKSFSENKTKNFLLFGLFISLIFLSHLFYAIYSLFFLLLYFFLKRYKLSFKIIFTFLIFLFSSSFFIIPFILEYQHYLYPQPQLNLGPPNILVLLGLSQEVGGYTGTYLGISILILAILGIINLKITHWKSILWLLSLILTFLLPFLEKYTDFLSAGLPPQRFLVYLIFFSALLIPNGFEYLIDKLKLSKKILFYFLLILILIDCLPSIIKLRYSEKENFLAVREEIYELLSYKKVFKVLDIDIPDDKIDNFRRLCRYPACNFLYGNLPSPLGPPYHQFAPKNMLYAYPWINYLSKELTDTISHSLSEDFLKITSLLGITQIITLPTLLGAGEEETYLLLKTGIEWDDRFLVSQAKPPLVYGETKLPIILASNVKKPMKKEKFIKEGTLFIAEDWQDFLKDIKIDYEKSKINFIPVLEKDSYESLPSETELKIYNYYVKHNEVQIEYELTNPGFLRLPISYYPYLKVYLDNKETNFYETKDHFIYLKSDRGKHILKVIFTLPPLRKYTLIFSLISFIISILLIIFKK